MHLAAFAFRRAAATTLDRRILLLKLIICLFHFAILATSIVSAELVYSARSTAGREGALGDSASANSAKLANTLLVVIELVLICLLYSLLWKQSSVQGRVLPGQFFTESPLLRALLFHLAIGALHWPVGCFALIQIYNYAGAYSVYDVESLVSVLQFARVVPLFNLAVGALTRFNTEAASVVARGGNVLLSTSLALRYAIKKWPVSATLSIYWLLVCALAYAMRVAERDVCFSTSTKVLDTSSACTADASGNRPKSLEFMSNTFWLVLITSLTVGYGGAFLFNEAQLNEAQLCEGGARCPPPKHSFCPQRSSNPPQTPPQTVNCTKSTNPNRHASAHVSWPQRSSCSRPDGPHRACDPCVRHHGPHQPLGGGGARHPFFGARSPAHRPPHHCWTTGA